MRLNARQFLICLVIIGSQHLFIISGNVNQPTPYPEPASCKSKKNCFKGAQCIRRECHCRGKYFYGDGKTKCERLNRCSNDKDCLKWGANYKNTICLIMNHPSDKPITCRCKEGYFGRANHPHCMKAAKKNGKYPCLANKNCPAYAKCHEGWCKCADELIGDGENCRSAPAHPCKKNEDCDERAACHRGKCRCAEDTTGNGKYCRDSLPCPKEYVEKCEAVGSSVEACVVDPLFPDQPECKCRVGFKTSEAGICVVLPHPCKKNEDCNERATCYRGKCQCEGKTTGNGKNCRDSLPCPKEYVEKCEAVGSNVVACVVDPLFPDKPECKCHVGFKTSEAGICVEMTECEKNDLVCPTGKVCKTSKGDYWCACKDGYEDIAHGAGNTICKDIDECSQDVCSAIENSLCTNIEGSYKCECKEGFRKSADQSTCEAVANQICHEGVCKCSPGFAKNSDEECIDVDECSQDDTPCGANEECLNDQGTYSCVCRTGYKKRNKVCTKEERCNCKRDEVCLKGKCKCKKGYKKSTKGYCVLRRRFTQTFQAGLGLSLHGNSFLSTFLLGVLGAWLSQST